MRGRADGDALGYGFGDPDKFEEFLGEYVPEDSGDDDGYHGNGDVAAKLLGNPDADGGRD